MFDVLRDLMCCIGKHNKIREWENIQRLPALAVHDISLQLTQSFPMLYACNKCNSLNYNRCFRNSASKAYSRKWIQCTIDKILPVVDDTHTHTRTYKNNNKKWNDVDGNKNGIDELEKILKEVVRKLLPFFPGNFVFCVSLRNQTDGWGNRSHTITQWAMSNCTMEIKMEFVYDLKNWFAHKHREIHNNLLYTQVKLIWHKSNSTIHRQHRSIE